MYCSIYYNLFIFFHLIFINVSKVNATAHKNFNFTLNKMQAGFALLHGKSQPHPLTQGIPRSSNNYGD